MESSKDDGQINSSDDVAKSCKNLVNLRSNNSRVYEA